MKDQKSQGPLKLGLVATDPLRILGLQSILAETGIKGGPVEIVPLSVPGALDSSGVSLILIDSACTSHIFELLAVFRRARPHLRLIVLGLEEDHEHIQRIIGAGAKGYLAHTAKASEVRMAIEVVEDGSAWAPRKVLANLVDLSSAEERRAATEEPSFTKREAQVLKLLVDGHPNRVIAEELGIDLATVKKHVGTLMLKVGVKNRITPLRRGNETQVASGVRVASRSGVEKASKIVDGCTLTPQLTTSAQRSTYLRTVVRAGNIRHASTQQHRPGRGVVETASGKPGTISTTPIFFSNRVHRGPQDGVSSTPGEADNLPCLFSHLIYCWK